MFGLNNHHNDSKLHIRYAYLLKAYIMPPAEFGDEQEGRKLVYVALDQSKPITFVSTGNYEPAFEVKESLFGGDLLRMDTDGKRARGNVRGAMKTSEDEYIYFTAKSIVTITSGVRKILERSADADTVPFGDYIVQVDFKAGGAYKQLENRIFVASGRFFMDEMGTGFEYRISEVVPEA